MAFLLKPLFAKYFIGNVANIMGADALATQGATMVLTVLNRKNSRTLRVTCRQRELLKLVSTIVVLNLSEETWNIFSLKFHGIGVVFMDLIDDKY